MSMKLLGFFVKDVELPPPLWENNPPGFLVMAHASEVYPAAALNADGGFAVDARILSQDEFLSEFHLAGDALHSAWGKALEELQASLSGSGPLRGSAQSAGLMEAVHRLCRTARDLPGEDSTRTFARPACSSAPTSRGMRNSPLSGFVRTASSRKTGKRRSSSPNSAGVKPKKFIDTRLSSGKCVYVCPPSSV